MPLQLSEAPVARDTQHPGQPDVGVVANRRARGGRPTREAAAELDRRILDTAADLFASQGFAATSMEQIAFACGSGKDTIYRRYASKTQLFSALMEGLRAQVIRELDGCMTGSQAPIDRLRQFSRALLSINLRAQMIALNRVALAEAVVFGGVRPTPVPRDPIMIRLATLVQAAQNDNALTTSDDPLFIAEQLLYGTSIKPLISQMLGEERFTTSVDEDSYFDRAWTLFMKGASYLDTDCPPQRLSRLETTPIGISAR